MIRAVRGAITVDSNTNQEITDATRELLTEIMQHNQLTREDIISAFFTLTSDLDAEFPAVGARQIGWQDIPLMCAQEINKPGGLPKCIRVMLHVHSNKSHKEIQHIYLRNAKALRPDLNIGGEQDGL